MIELTKVSNLEVPVSTGVPGLNIFPSGKIQVAIIIIANHWI
jgi:hypothetical protein